MSQISLYPANPATITGNVTVVQPTGSNLHVQVDASALPTGAATSALQTTANTSLSSIDTKLTSPLTTKISNGTITAEIKPLGTQVANADNGIVTNSVIHGLSSGGGGSYIDVKVNPSGALTVEASVTSSTLPTGAATETTLSALNTKVPSNLTVTSTRLLVDGSGVTQPVSVAATLTTNEAAASTATLTNVTSSASSTSILASNSSRKGMLLYNDSTSSLYLKFGTTASTTSFTVLIPPAGYYEMPGPKIYSGAIDGIWSSANGAARVTELS